MTETIDTVAATAAVSDAVAASIALTNTPPKRPGRLHGDVELTLHTFQASELLLGRQATDDKRGILSINNFGFHIEQIVTAAKSSDIYAAAALVRIDDKLDAAERLLSQELDLLEAKLAANSRLSVTVGLSTEPVVHRLQLTSPYAHWAARLIGSYDELVATALSARRAGFIRNRELASIAVVARKAIRGVFYTARTFKFSGVTREDFDQQNARAVAAVSEHGAIAEDILLQRRKPAYLH